MDVIDLEKPKDTNPEIQIGFITAEVIFFVIATVGLLFKIMHWPGASVFLLFGLGLLGMLLFPIGLFYKFWQLKVINLFQSVICIGILFKLMDWPAKAHLYIGLLSTLVILVLLYFLNVQQKGFIKKNKFISFRIVSLILLCWLINFITARTYYHTFVNDDPIGATLYEKANNDQSNKEAREAYYEYRRSLNRPYSLDSTDVNK